MIVRDSAHLAELKATGVLTQRDVREVRYFSRFLAEVGVGPVPRDWRAYALGVGPPPENTLGREIEIFGEPRGL